MRDAKLHRVKADLVLVREFVRVTQTGKLMRTVPQGGIPSVLLILPYSFRDRGEYSWANLNGRLIDDGELVANVEHVAFTAARVKQFEQVFPVDLFAQAIHVDFDRV